MLGLVPELTAAGALRLHQDTPGVAGTAATGDRFGLSVAIAPITGAGIETLLVGIPAEGVPGTPTQHAGAFEVFGHTRTGPSARGSKLWTLEEPGMRGQSAPGTYLGCAIT